MWKTLVRPLLAPVATPIMCDVRFLAFFWVWVRGFRKWPFGPVSASLGRFRSGPHRSSASGRFRSGFRRFLVPSQGGTDTCAFVHKVARLRSSVRAPFLFLSSSVCVRLTFRPFVAWLARRCCGTNLRSCPIGGALWSVGSCGSWWAGSVVAGRSDRPAVRLPWVPCRVGRPGSWLALPGFGPGGAIMCDIGFLGAVRFFGHPVVRVVVPGGLGKFGFCSFGFCSVWPLSYQSTN